MAHVKLQVTVELIAHVQRLGAEAVVPSVVLATSQIDVTEFFGGVAIKQVVLEFRPAIATAKEKSETVLRNLWLSTEASSHTDTCVDLEPIFLAIVRRQEFKRAVSFRFTSVPTRMSVNPVFVAE